MKINIYKLTIFIILSAYIISLVMSTTGYYQTELKEKTILTNDAIKTFEKDIKEGKDIDINNYLELNKKDYDNKFSKTGRTISKKVKQIISLGFEKTLKIIIKSIEE